MPATALAAATTATTAGVATGIGSGAAVDLANGNTFDNSTGNRVLSVYNGSGGTLTVTITRFPTGAVGVTPDGMTVSNLAVTIPTLTGKQIGPFPKRIYNDAANNVTIAWSTGTSVTALVIDEAPNP